MQVYINDFGVSIWPIYLLILIVAFIHKFKQRKGLPYLICFALFWIYIYYCLNEVFFPIDINTDYAIAMKENSFQSFINLIPFYSGNIGFNSHVLIERLLNILLTVPFGFGLNFIKKVNPKSFIWMPIALGIGIELVQLFISLILRYPYRVIDINDSIMNAAGVLIGYGLFKLFSLIFISMTNRFKLEHSGLTRYIHDMVT